MNGKPHDAPRQVFGDGLNHRVTLYVPSTENVKIKLSEVASRQFVERTLRFLSELFGGATAVQASGSWLAGNGGLVIESVTLVYSFTITLNVDSLQAIRQYAVQIRDELGQEAVAVEIDGKLYFV